MTAVSMITRIAKNDPTLTECELGRGDEPNISELAEALKTNRSLLKLHLGNNEFGPAGGEALAGALKVNTVLTEIVLWGCGLKDIRKLSNVLKINRSLRTLNLSFNKFGNAGGEALAGALKVNGALTEIDLGSDCGLTNIKELAEALKTNRSLRTLRLSSNNFGNVGGIALARALKVNTVLTDLDLYECGLTDIKEFAESLKTNRSLSKLVLYGNKFGNAGGVALAGALKVNSVLTELNLAYCSLTVIKEFADSLKTNRSLLKLKLDGNEFRNAGGVALAGALKVNVVLTELILVGCCLTDIKVLAESLMTNRSLKTLNLRYNAFGPAGGVALAGALKVNAALTECDLSACQLTNIRELAESLKRNRGLSTIDLGRNGLTDIKELTESLKSNRSLRTLRMRFNAFGPAGGVALAGALKVNTVLTELDVYRCGLTDIKEFADSLETNRTLTKLDLRDNQFGNAGGVVLAGALKVNTALTELYLYGCGLTDMKEFAESLKTNRSLTKLSLDKFGFADGLALAGAFKTVLEEALKINRSLLQARKEKDAKTVAPVPTAAGGQAVSVPPLPPSFAQKLTLLPPPASLTAAGSSFTAVLDEETINRLKALPGKHDALARQVEKLAVIDVVTLEALRGRADALQRMFEAEALSTLNKHEKDIIHADANLKIYYEFFSRLLTGTWMACQTINSGLVANSKKDNLDYVGQGIDEIGKRIPVVSLFTGIFSGIISAWTAREKTIAVQRIALLFPDLESAFKDLGQLARQLTLAQREAIVRIESQPVKLLDKMKGGAKDLKATLLGEDVKGPLKRKAIEDCEKILTAIRDENPKARPTVADLLTVVLGANFVYKPAPLLATTVAAAAMPTEATSPTQAAALSPQSPTTEELLERLRKMEEMAEKLREQDREREAELKRLKAKLDEQKPDDEEEVSGGNMAQAQLSASKVARRTANADTATAAVHAEVHHHVQVVTTRVDVHDARLEEHADDILALKAKLKQLEKGRKSS